MATLTTADADRRLQNLEGWTRAGEAIQAEYRFSTFPEAIAFINRLAPEVEAVDHHPEILVSYRTVTLTYTSHSEGGLTEKDFDGAALADRLARAE